MKQGGKENRTHRKELEELHMSGASYKHEARSEKPLERVSERKQG